MSSSSIFAAISADRGMGSPPIRRTMHDIIHSYMQAALLLESHERSTREARFRCHKFVMMAANGGRGSWSKTRKHSPRLSTEGNWAHSNAWQFFAHRCGNGGISTPNPPAFCRARASPEFSSHTVGSGLLFSIRPVSDDAGGRSLWRLWPIDRQAAASACMRSLLGLCSFGGASPLGFH